MQKAKDLIYERRRLFHENKDKMKRRISLDLGGRKLFFAQTYDSKKALMKHLLKKEGDKRKVAINVQYPQELMHMSDYKLYANEAACYRLEFSKYAPKEKYAKDVTFKLISEQSDIDQVNKIYEHYGMYPLTKESFDKNQYSAGVNYYVAEKNGKILGIVVGVNHVKLLNSPEKGSSLWGLAVIPDAGGKGVGRLLIDYLVGHFRTKELNYMDLYVDYYNKKAINLYRKLGFEKIQRFIVAPMNSQ